MSSDLVDDALWRRTYSKDCSTSTRNLRASCIMNDLCTYTQTHGLGLQYLKLLLALDLNGHFGLAISFPLIQNVLSRRLLE